LESSSESSEPEAPKRPITVRFKDDSKKPVGKPVKQPERKTFLQRIFGVFKCKKK
jgi:hypothetical protein